jgi:multiple sugar transport system substrate-binding protein
MALGEQTLVVSRRALLGGTLGILGGVVLASCAGGTGSSVSSTAVRTASDPNSAATVYKPLVSAFKKKSGITLQIIERDLDQLHRDVALDLSRGQGTYDAVPVDDVVWIAEMNKGLTPIQPLIDKDGFDTSIFEPALLNAYMYEGKLLALPQNIAPWVLWYNEDWFTAIGAEPPRTFEELLVVGKELTDPSKDRWGFYGFFQQNAATSTWWVPFLRSFGSDVFESDNKTIKFTDDAGVAATQYLVDLIRTSGIVPKDALDASHQQVIAAMANDRAAMTIAPAAYYPAVVPQSKSSWNVAKYLPYAKDSGLQNGKGLISGWGMGIAKSAKNPQGAWEAAKYWASADAQKKLALGQGLVPCVTSVLEDPEYLAKFKGAAGVQAVAPLCSTRPPVGQWEDIANIMAASLSKAFTGELRTKAALDEGAAKIRDLMG